MTIPKSQAELQYFIQKPSYGKVTTIHERALKSRTLTHATLVAISEHVKITKDQHKIFLNFSFMCDVHDRSFCNIIPRNFISVTLSIYV